MKRSPTDKPQSGRCLPYLCQTFAATSWDGAGLCGTARLVIGGAWARLMLGVRCTRALSLISVLGPEGLRAGDMMGGGVIPLGYAVRPLGL